MRLAGVVCPEDFNPLPRKEGDTRLLHYGKGWRYHFNPLPRKEGDVNRQYSKNSEKFQSTPS